jgi:hypothetical protein
MNKILFALLFLYSLDASSFSNKVMSKNPIEDFELGSSGLANEFFLQSIPYSFSLTVPQSINWSGTWTCENDLGIFSIMVNPEEEGIIKCTLSAEGMQLFYELDCRGRMNGNSFELYFVSTNDGVFNEEESITPEKPLLILTSSNGKVLTNWGQLTEEKSGMVCFKKTK